MKLPAPPRPMRLNTSDMLWGSSLVSFSFPFTAAAMTIEGNDSGPLGKFDAEHAGTVERDRFLYVQYQITTVKAALPDRIDA